MDKIRKRLFLLFLLFTVGFYGYHVRQFGVGSWISTMSLASCMSLLGFIHLFFKVGSRV